MTCCACTRAFNLLIDKKVVSDITLLRPSRSFKSLLAYLKILFERFTFALFFGVFLFEVFGAMVLVLVLQLKVSASPIYDVAEHL